MIYKDLGLPLRASNVGEADKIFTILTKENGKVQAVAKGVRKIQSRKRGNVEVGSISNFTFYKGRNFSTITECELTEFYENLRSFDGLKFIMEILKNGDKFSNTVESSNFLFTLCQACLNAANVKDSDIKRVLFWFRLRLASYESTMSDFEKDINLDDRFKLLINIFLRKSLDEIMGLNISSETLSKLDQFSINSLQIQ